MYKEKCRFFLNILMLLSFMFVACGGDDSDDNGGNGGGSGSATITVSQKDLSVPAIGGNYTINVTQTGREWNATPSTDWIKVTVSGSTSQTGTIAVVVSANNGGERTGTITVKSGTTREIITVTQGVALHVSKTDVYSNSKGEEQTVEIYSGSDWTATANDAWITTEKIGNTLIINTAANDATMKRTGSVDVTTDTEKVTITVTQESAEDREMNIPDGYRLVWHDEFSEGNQLNSKDWEWENQNSGWVNHELENYRPGTQTIDGMHTTEIIDGKLNINCFKGSDGKIYSGRVNAKNNGAGWQYGYMEARIMLPKGKGTWPAFWMMPISVDWANEGWPKCGEIDIMEEVGYHPNYVSSSLHAEGHVHTNGTQVTKETYIDGAEGDFHVYAIEWSKEKIITYVDNVKLLEYASDGTIRNYPYDKAFHIILNLAWGGDWGGANGTDESVLPVTMKVDYVRVFQKK